MCARRRAYTRACRRRPRAIRASGWASWPKTRRMKARTAHIQTVLTGDFKTQWEAKLKAGGLTGSSGEFSLIMAALKRDNGIIAIDYDLFAMARDNLEEAVDLRSNDPRAQLYLGKVISLTARTPEDRQQAEEHFMKAIQYDGARGAYPDPHLEHALHLIGENGDKGEIKNEIEAYVALYQREHMGSLPNNMAILYDYLTLVGDTNWYAAPAAVVSTRNVEAIRINSSGGHCSSDGTAGDLVRAGQPTRLRRRNPYRRQRTHQRHLQRLKRRPSAQRRRAGNETSGLAVGLGCICTRWHRHRLSSGSRSGLPQPTMQAAMTSAKPWCSI